MINVYVNGKRHRLNPADAIGKGGEADIFSVGTDTALKVFKDPSHPDLTGDARGQQAARARLAEHQQKLASFPSGLPSRVITPTALAYNHAGTQVMGYTMPKVRDGEVLLRYGDRRYRDAGIDDETATAVLRDLHETVSGVHDRRVVIGDFNDLNVLVVGTSAYLIDADSFQFGRFACTQFTIGFVDPLICDPHTTTPQPVAPHSADTDWFAFAAMVMRTLLYVGPYGGVYKPANGTHMPQDARPLHRITVFDDGVRYPKPARRPEVLPDELLQHLYNIFRHDTRGPFPKDLLDNLEWKTCGDCGGVYARGVCPHCGHVPAQAVSSVFTGTVSAEKMFETTGRIVFAGAADGTLRWVVHDDEAYRREDGRLVRRGPLEPNVRIRIQGDNTVVATDDRAHVVARDGSSEQIAVDSYGQVPAVTTGARHVYWLSGGRLYRSGRLGLAYPEVLGEGIRGQTMIWTGGSHGFGFYRAGRFSQCFLFDSTQRVINDSLSLAPFEGQLIDATCRFGHKRMWFLVSQRIGGETVNRCYLIRTDGTHEATAEARADDGSWLGGIHGSCAAGDFLLVATDDGVVRVKANGDRLAVDKRFPDTARFVDAGKHLSVLADGLAVVGSREIWKLTLSEGGDTTS